MWGKKVASYRTCEERHTAASPPHGSFYSMHNYLTVKKKITMILFCITCVLTMPIDMSDITAIKIQFPSKLVML